MTTSGRDYSAVGVVFWELANLLAVRVPLKPMRRRQHDNLFGSI